MISTAPFVLIENIGIVNYHVCWRLELSLPEDPNEWSCQDLGIFICCCCADVVMLLLLLFSFQQQPTSFLLQQQSYRPNPSSSTYLNYVSFYQRLANHQFSHDILCAASYQRLANHQFSNALVFGQSSWSSLKGVGDWDIYWGRRTNRVCPPGPVLGTELRPNGGGYLGL